MGGFWGGYSFPPPSPVAVTTGYHRGKGSGERWRSSPQPPGAAMGLLPSPPRSKPSPVLLVCFWGVRERAGGGYHPAGKAGNPGGFPASWALLCISEKGCRSASAFWELSGCGCERGVSGLGVGGLGGGDTHGQAAEGEGWMARVVMMRRRGRKEGWGRCGVGGWG